MIKQRLENEFSSEEMESWAQEVRTAMKESPDENEEPFPNDAEELRDYILTLEENMKHKPTDHLREELRVYKAHQTGWYKGVCFTYEYFIDLKEKERVREEDKIANEVYDKKLCAWLNKQDPKRDISKTDLLNVKETQLTREDLEKAGIQNTERYLVEEPKKKKRKKRKKEDEEEIKPTLLDGGPMFETEEEFQKMKKVLADDPDMPKGHWVEDGQMKTYMFDKPKKEKGK